jgi:membrane peptidoglycan carboxypeptidase
MAGAFGVLANKGVRCAPYSITKVVAPGERKPLIENKPDCDQVISEKISTRTVAMLRGVINGGTGRRASLGARPVAGKTGSAQDNLSAFFSGFTPQLSTSVWVGFRARRVPMRTQFNGGPVYGGTFPALIFHDFMSAALQGQPIVGFPAAPPPPKPPEPKEPPKPPKPGKPPKPPKPPKPGRGAPPTTQSGRLDVVVPAVVGLPAGTARSVLTSSGLSPGMAYTTSGQPGRVAAQSPGPGSRLRRGSYVTLVVGRRT